MEKTYLSEAFKQLEILNEEDFNLSADKAVDDIKGFLDTDAKQDFVDVIDPEAESEEELEDSYLGKVILDCCVCHSKIYKNPEDITISEDEELANVGEECPFCYTNDGFKVIGQVAPFSDEVAPEDNGEVKVDDEPVVPEDTTDKPEDEDKVDEGLAGALVGGLAGAAVGHPIVGAAVGNAIGNNVQKKIDKNLYDDGKDQEEKKRAAIGESLRRARRNKIQEGFEKVEIKTEDSDIEVKNEDDAVKVEIKKNKGLGIEPPIGGPETIKPVEPEVEDEINANSGIKDELPDVRAEIDLPVDDFDEESFNGLGEGYLKKVYENVESFKTSSVSQKDNKLTVEGVIKFNSGKEKKTSFVFESKEAYKNGRVRFIGENCQISRGKKSFTLTGSIQENKLVCESLNYNYRTKADDGKSTRVYGTIRKA